MHRKEIITRGKKPEEAVDVLILIHGRGGSAEDILSLAPDFPLRDFALLAPQATNHGWYPYSFMALAASNEPWLSSALSMLNKLGRNWNPKEFPSRIFTFSDFHREPV